MEHWTLGAWLLHAGLGVHHGSAMLAKRLQLLLVPGLGGILVPACLLARSSALMHHTPLTQTDRRGQEADPSIDRNMPNDLRSELNEVRA